MEFGTIEREIYVEASPEVVFEVVSSPEHVQQWWPDEAHYEPVPGSNGDIVFGGAGDAAGPWCSSPSSRRSRRGRSRSAGRIRSASRPAAGNSLLVTFDLTPSGGGTLLKMTETRLPRDGLGGRRPRAAVPRARHRLGLLPASARAVRRDAGGAAVSTARRGAHRRRPLVGDRRPDPAADRSTCCSPTATAPPPR